MPKGIYLHKSHTEEHRKNMSIAMKDNWSKRPIKGGWKLSLEARKKISVYQKGKMHSLGHKQTEEHKRNISESNKGEKSYRWIKDRTKLKIYGDDNKDRRSSAYGEWRKQVWLRDNFKCKIVNADCKGRIEAHHILGYKEHPELRYDINNGITLCHFHHPRKKEEEKRLSPYFQELVSVSKE